MKEREIVIKGIEIGTGDEVHWSYEHTKKGKVKKQGIFLDSFDNFGTKYAIVWVRGNKSTSFVPVSNLAPLTPYD